MNSRYLIVGATGAIGYAVTKALIDSGESVTALVRDKGKALRLFGNTTHLEIVEGDVNDTELLSALCMGKKFIFHGANVAYQHWAEAMPGMTRSIIDAAEAAGATVIFPGNNYNYGSLESPITELTPFNPNSEAGRVRVQIEKMLELASDQGRIKTLVVRLSEVWGPNVCNKMFAPVFENVLRGKSMPWLVTTDVPQQLVYNLDAGRAIAQLTQRDAKQAYEVYNVSGELVPSIEHWLRQIACVAEQEASISVVPAVMVKFLSLFVPMMKSVKSLLYKHEKTILLDDKKFQQQYPMFETTPMEIAIADTLTWFRQNGKHGAENLKARSQYRKRALYKILIDNAAIGIFPLIIALLVSQFAFLNDMAVLLGVVAGIYWTPGLHALAARVFPKRLNVL